PLRLDGSRMTGRRHGATRSGNALPRASRCAAGDVPRTSLLPSSTSVRPPRPTLLDRRWCWTVARLCANRILNDHLLGARVLACLGVYECDGMVDRRGLFPHPSNTAVARGREFDRTPQ